MTTCPFSSTGDNKSTITLSEKFVTSEVPDPIWREVKEPEARNVTDNIVKAQLGLVNWKLLVGERGKEAAYETSTCFSAINVSE
jgi:hypothetical protein